MIDHPPMPRHARLLGFAGLLPQLIALGFVVSGNDRYTFAAQSLAFAYASLILSFLGGLWWGLAARAEQPPRWIWLASVAPSLFALMCFLPWAFAGSWPGPSLIALAAALVVSLAVDTRLVRAALAPRWWLYLRVPLSVGLGIMTLAIGLLA
jgi:hypothetical protein